MLTKYRFRMINLKLILIVVISFAVVLFVFFENSGQNISSHQILVNSSDPYVKEYSLHEGSRPNALLVDTQGIVWISTSNSQELLSLDPKNEIIKIFDIKDYSRNEPMKSNSSMVWTMIQDNAGKIWFSGLGTQSIWRFDPRNETFHMLHSESGSPFQMKASENGDIWFTTLRGDVLGVIEKQYSGDYKISTFEVGNNTTPAGIFLQNDSMWIANVESQNISQYHINLQNNYVKNIFLIQSIPKYKDAIFSSPTDLLVNNNSIWLTEHGTSFLTRYDMDTGKVMRYPTSQNNFHTTTLPFWIRATENPRFLWFNEHEGNKIGYFDLENKTLVEYSIPSKPTNGTLTYLLNISEDPTDGKKLWFSEWNADKVGMIDAHIPVPFTVTTTTKQITLNSHKLDDSIDFEVQGNSYNSNHVFLNASSSITPTGELGNLTIKFSPDVIDILHDKKVKLLIHDGGVVPGNYTIGISVSDGYVTKTGFLDLSISR